MSVENGQKQNQGLRQRGDTSWIKLRMRTEKLAKCWKVVLTNALYIEAKRREGLTNRTEPEI